MPLAHNPDDAGFIPLRRESRPAQNARKGFSVGKIATDALRADAVHRRVRDHQLDAGLGAVGFER
jgi:hypothetical protein